jgi:hypothetical protein
MKFFGRSFLLCLTTLSAFSYGPRGHETVGALADLQLAGTPVYPVVTALLSGMTLQQAAILPDQIKAWDTKRPVSVAAISGKTWQNVPEEIKAALFEFWKANPPTSASGQPSHHIFHYTDVPIDGQPLAYADAKAGVNNFDLIHMIPFCAGVLKGTIPENNARRISKPVAVILLAHYIGDLHQPLHVGAAYFDHKAKRKAPMNDHDPDARPDKGGNDIFYPVAKRQTSVDSRSSNLHHYWDENSVASAFRQLKLGTHATPVAAAQKLLINLPAATGDLSDPEKWTISRADRILPLAKEAHDRLAFKLITVNDRKAGTKGKGIAGQAKNGLDDYLSWAGGVVTNELQMGGLDLAAALTALLSP